VGRLKLNLVSEAINASGVLPWASTEVRWPVVVSSMAPRAMVSEPSERISTISRAGWSPPQRHLPVVGFTMNPGAQAQVRSARQRPRRAETVGSSLQVWSAPAVQAGRTHPRAGRKHAPAGQLHTITM
jgi:hypothetical protein